MWVGEVIRDFLYIDDAIDAYVKLGIVDRSIIDNNIVLNFGSNNKVTVEQLINKIISLSGKKITIEKISQKRESEVKSQYVSWNKVKRLLQWEPKTSFDVGLRKTYEWYTAYFSQKQWNPA